MNDKPPKDRKWYQKKRYIIPSLVIGFLLANNQSSQTTNSTPSYITPANQVQVTKPSIKETSQISPIAPGTQATKPRIETKTISNETTPPPSYEQKQIKPKEVPLSNNNHYTNTSGEEVHSPAYAPSVPQGASAICGDGTYSFSRSRRGTCSHHGGVAEWL